ncbi:WAT1-related protein At1g43650-like [Olea europaea var. sylvestris]|uniref:WAT1-related protein At1g43650-like n=1 Tax=Olea europaea var. sylvestris TaxID=158386 RepID=UPI000C1D6235|nr:WAT1-related protein At1g43650-like [Olea europaea var. sylvestris]
MVSLPCCGMNMEKNKLYIIMISIQFIYAGMALFSKASITQDMNPYVFVVYRQAFASVALAPVAFFMERSGKAPSHSFILLGKIFLVSSLGYVQDQFSLFLCNLGASNLQAFYKNKTKTSNDLSEKHHSKADWLKGSLLIFAANVTWSLWLNMQVPHEVINLNYGPLIRQYPTKLRLTALQCFFSRISSAIFAVVKERIAEPWKLGWNLRLLSVCYCGVIVTGLTYWLQFWVVQKKGHVFTAAFSPLALIITAIFSAILFKETLYWGSVCGAIMLVIGLYGILWGKNKERKAETTEEKNVENEEEEKLS